MSKEMTLEELAKQAEKMGHALVPLEATEEMHNAARDWSIGVYGIGIGYKASEGCYKAMIEAGRVKWE